MRREHGSARGVKPRSCQCGASRIDSADDGRECGRPLGRRPVLVYIVPDCERGSAAASGAYTYYGGTKAVPVSRECYRHWVSDFLSTDDQAFIRTEEP